MKIIKIGGHFVNISAVTRIEMVTEKHEDGSHAVAILFLPDGKHYRISEADLSDIFDKTGNTAIREYQNLG